MKKILFFSLSLLGFCLFAQEYKMPAKSPRQQVNQQFSISTIAVDYGRPSARGRQVFGQLVPFEKVWRLGANQATSFECGIDLLVAGNPLAKGKYAMYAIPSKDNWILIFNKGVDNWGAYGYKEEDDVLRVKIPTQKLNSLVEVFSIDFSQLESEKLMLNLSWEKTKIAVPIEVAKPNEVNKIASELMKKRNAKK